MAWMEHSKKLLLKRQHYIGFRSDLVNGEYKLSPDGKEFTVDEMVKARQNVKFIVADGYDEKTKTIYQYHGCYYHNHRSKHCTLNNNEDSTRVGLYKRLKAQNSLLKEKGYNIVERGNANGCWKKINADVKAFLKRNNRNINHMQKCVMHILVGDEIFAYCDCRRRLQNSVYRYNV